MIDVIAEIAAVQGYYNDPRYHFVYKSGLHGCAYLNMDPLFPYQRAMRQICIEMAWPFRDQFDAVVGAATGGIPLAAWVALEWDIEIMAWADKVGDGFAFERAGFTDSLKGRRVLIVEDIANQGKTLRAIIELVRANGGEVIGVACAVNRGGLTEASLDIPRFVSLCEIELDAYKPSDCPGCHNFVPIVTDIGHGQEFADSNHHYPGGFTTLLRG